MTLPMPAWLSKVPERRRDAARKRFLLRVAALMVSETGSQAVLSGKLGLAYKTLATFTAPTTTKKISPKIAHNIERLTDGLIRASDLTDGML